MATGYFNYWTENPEVDLQAEFSITTPAPKVERKLIAIGGSTITWPSGATVAIVIPPADGRDEDNRILDGTIKLTGPNATDTGVALKPFLPIIITKGADSSFNVVRTSATGSIFFEVIFI